MPHAKHRPGTDNEILCYGCEEDVGGDWNGEDWPPYCMDCQISRAEYQYETYKDDPEMWRKDD